MSKFPTPYWIEHSRDKEFANLKRALKSGRNYVFQYSGTGNPQDQEFRERMEILKTDYAGSLLIIDNFDRKGTDLAELQREPA